MLSKDETLQKIKDLEKYVCYLPEDNEIYKSLRNIGIPDRYLTQNSNGDVELRGSEGGLFFYSSLFGTKARFHLLSNSVLVIEK